MWDLFLRTSGLSPFSTQGPQRDVFIIRVHKFIWNRSGDQKFCNFHWIHSMTSEIACFSHSSQSSCRWYLWVNLHVSDNDLWFWRTSGPWSHVLVSILVCYCEEDNLMLHTLLFSFHFRSSVSKTHPRSCMFFHSGSSKYSPKKKSFSGFMNSF